MTEAEWSEWTRLNDIQPPANRAADPCEDCIVRFAVLMRLEGRCDGWPHDRPEGRPWSPSVDERHQNRRSQWRDAKQRQRMRARVTA